MIARQIGSIKSGAATGAGRPSEAAEGGVQAALCGKPRQGRWFESTTRSIDLALGLRRAFSGRVHALAEWSAATRRKRTLEGETTFRAAKFVGSDRDHALSRRHWKHWGTTEFKGVVAGE